MRPTFAAANVPLSAQQADGLADALAAGARLVRANHTDLGHTRIMEWDAVVAGARAILTPEQLRVLQTYVERRKAAKGSQ